MPKNYSFAASSRSNAMKNVLSSLPVFFSLIALSIVSLAIASNYEGIIELKLGIEGGQIKIDGRKE